MKKIIKLSVLNLDQKNETNFKNQIELCMQKGIKDIHFDVMDNIFVPNTSFYNLEYLDFLISQNLNISIHLMVKDVLSYIKKLIKTKVKFITFHCEAITINQSVEIIKLVKANNIKIGIAIKPQSDLTIYQSLIKFSDIITVMSVEPGFGGQKYIKGSEARIKLIKKIATQNPIIEIDGGINDITILLCKNEAHHFVTGSYLLNNLDNYHNLVNLIN